MTDTVSSNRQTVRRVGVALSFVWLPILLLAWIFISSANSTDVYFPAATDVTATIVDGFAEGTLTEALAYSMFNFACGYAIAAVLGIAGGLFLGEQRILRDATRPLLNFVRALPFVALVPIFIVALGVGAPPKIALITLGCIWPILLNTTDGVRGIPDAVLATARSYRIKHSLRLRRVTFMGALPQTFAGLRIALSVGIVLVVVSEMYGSAEGIGYYILFSAQRFAVVETWAATVVLAIVGYVLNVLFIWVERASLGWYFRRAAT